MKMTTKIKGISVPPPVGWEKASLVATFRTDDGVVDRAQAVVDVDTFEFVNEANELIVAELNNIFEGLPYEWNLEDDFGNKVDYKAYINLSEGFRIVNPVKCMAKVNPLGTINELTDKLDGLTFELLAAQKYIVANDFVILKYVVEKEYTAAETAALILATLMLLKQVQQLVKEIRTDLTNISSLFSGGGPIVGQVVAIIMASILMGLNIAYGAAILALLYNMVRDLFNKIFAATKEVKGLTMNKALEKIFLFCGYAFVKSIPFYDKVGMFPSKPSKTKAADNDREGIPNSGDPYYYAINTVGYAKSIVRGEYKIDHQLRTVELIPLNSNKWQQQSTFTAANVLSEGKVFNTGEVRNTKLLRFMTDSQNAWSKEDYRGNSYEIHTEPQTVQHRDYLNIKNTHEIVWPFQLGKRKTDLSGLENAMLDVAKVLDKVADTFKSVIGKSKATAAQTVGQPISGNPPQSIPSLTSVIQNRANVMRVENTYWDVPILAYVDGGYIPANHLDFLSAKALWDNYHSYDSFVANNFSGQRIIVEDQVIPFTLADWLTCSKNKFFTLADGRQAEFTSIKWGFAKDTAVVSYRIKEVYTTNLKETKYEAA